MIENRNELARYFASLGFKVGAEIGVLGGKYSVELCQQIPNLKLYCVDSWGLGEKRYRDYHFRKYEEAKQRLSPYNCKLIRNTSMEALREIDEPLDFVYIDAKHQFNFVMQDIIGWAKKVRAGGIVAGDDYIDGSPSTGVKDAVNVYLKYYGAELNLTKDNNWYFVRR